jgi:hypothetical protein
MEAVLTYAGTKLVDSIFGGMGNTHTVEYRTDPAVLELLKTYVTPHSPFADTFRFLLCLRT